MMTIAGALERYGGVPFVLRSSGVATGAAVMARAAELVAAGRDAAPIVASSDSAVEIVGALVAGERSGRPVVLVPPHTAAPTVDGGHAFEILLMTSGTTGPPKVVRHAPGAVTARIRSDAAPAVWLLTYSGASFAGLQVILTALFSRSQLIEAESRSIADLVAAAGRHHATHVSGTPTFWRSWLTAAADSSRVPLAQITIGGEAVDQATLDRLARAHPAARVVHIYASTEAGALFAVSDGRAGFPAAWLHTGVEGTALRIRDDVLEVCSPRRMIGYAAGGPLAEGDGWLSTRDLVTIENDRVLFSGRADEIVNVGGYKVAPERVERVLMDVPGVADALVYGRPNVITGQVVVADLVCDGSRDVGDTIAAAQHAARSRLAKHEVPARFTVVDRLDVLASGKKRRR